MNSLANTPGIWDMISGAGPVVKLVLLTLFFFSVFSWAIILYKTILLRKIDKESSAFYDYFSKQTDLHQLYAAAKNYEVTPLARLYKAAYPEIQLSADKTAQTAKTGYMTRLLKKTSEEERAGMEKSISFLATTGNTAPFIGLFGTVWGIMNTFSSIGSKGSANLAVVAPGIAEALIATAMGLVAAIPAVMGYNYLVTRIERVAKEMDGFSSELINMAEAGALTSVAAEDETPEAE